MSILINNTLFNKQQVAYYRKTVMCLYCHNDIPIIRLTKNNCLCEICENIYCVKDPYNNELKEDE